jgi:DNA helicase-2/ATP-dependent DNA helicase PcrA
MEPSLFLGEADLSKVRVVGTPPYGFTLPMAGRPGAGKSAASGGAGKRQTSSDGRWQVGDRVFNDDKGYGEVIAIHENEEEGPIINVRYENGRLQRFLSRGMSSRFMKVGE